MRARMGSGVREVGGLRELAGRSGSCAYDLACVDCIRVFLSLSLTLTGVGTEKRRRTRTPIPVSCHPYAWTSAAAQRV